MEFKLLQLLVLLFLGNVAFFELVMSLQHFVQNNVNVVLEASRAQCFTLIFLCVHV